MTPSPPADRPRPGAATAADTPEAAAVAAGTPAAGTPAAGTAAAASAPSAGSRSASRRRAIALLAVVAALAAAGVGALLTADAVGGLNLTVERISSGSTGFLGDVSRLLPLGIAFGAGMVSSVNPCGFPLLPAYLGLFLGEKDATPGARPAARLVRALAIGGTVTLAFVLLATAAGLTIGLGARAIVDVLPWIALALGIVLVLAGGYRLAGGSLYSALPERLGARVGGSGGSMVPGVRSYFTFGLAYGLASLSCTLPIFLAVVGTSITGATLFSSLGSLVLYGLGMGTVIIVLTIAAALFKEALARRLRAVLRYVDSIGTIALLVAGAYIIYYWLTIGGILP